MPAPEHPGRAAVHEGFCSPLTGCFRETGRVDPEVERAARATLEEVSAALEIDPPEMVFMVQVAWHSSTVREAGDFVFSWAEGFTQRDLGRIWISAALPVERVAEIVAHEVAHIAGWDDEAGARAFASEFVGAGPWR